MKKQELKEENERLRERLLKAENELGKIKRKEENDKIQSIFQQLHNEFGFSVEHKIIGECNPLFYSTTDIYTLRRERRL